MAKQPGGASAEGSGPTSDPAQGIRPIWGYMLALLIGLASVAAVTWISIGFL